MQDSVGFQVCDPEFPGIIEDTASFDADCAGRSADWLGRPIPCVFALYLSLSIQYIVLIAGVLNLLLVAMLSHYSKGDDAIRYTCRDGAAHLSTHWRFIDTSISPAGPSLITWCFRWVTLICPALPIHGGSSSNLLIMDNSTISWCLG